jgi:tRNA threonylcarbamoyladenosine biosynthesis protein TsaE
MEISVRNLQEFNEFAKKFGKNLKGGEVIGLIGDLGAGKTAFSKALLKSLGVKEEVTSPTFVLMIPYATKQLPLTVYHMDLYRLNDYEEVKALGIEELFDQKGNVFLVEWADKIKNQLPKKTIYLKFQLEGTGRRISITNAPKDFKI